MSRDNLMYSSSGHLYYLLNSIQIGKKNISISSVTRDYKKHNLRNIQLEEHKGRTLKIEGTHLTGTNLQGIRYPDS